MDRLERGSLYRLTWLAAAMSLGHHLDHVIRRNAVGWPLTDELNAFGISLVVHPVIAAGLLAYRAGRVGPGFRALVSGGGAIFVGAVHFGPFAVEPPDMILGYYRPPVVGWLAFALLVAFVTGWASRACTRRGCGGSSAGTCAPPGRRWVWGCGDDRRDTFCGAAGRPPTSRGPGPLADPDRLGYALLTVAGLVAWVGPARLP